MNEKGPNCLGAALRQNKGKKLGTPCFYECQWTGRCESYKEESFKVQWKSMCMKNEKVVSEEWCHMI